MPARPRSARNRFGWLWHLAVVFTTVSQLTGVFLPLLEGREGRGMGTHIEAPGHRPHYVHDESTCGACHVRSMHGRVAAPPRVPIPQDREPVTFGFAALSPPRAEWPSANHARAPPTPS